MVQALALVLAVLCVQYPLRSMRAFDELSNLVIAGHGLLLSH